MLREVSYEKTVYIIMLEKMHYAHESCRHAKAQ